MRKIAMSCAMLGVLLFAAPTAADPAQTQRRFVSQSGAFSISMDLFADRTFHPKAESAHGDIVIVEFPYLNSMGLELDWQRTVEWIRIDKPIDPSQYDQQATAAVTGYLEGRFNGTLAVVDRGKFRDADGRLVYVFAAKGQFQHLPAQWQGVVIFFDTGVAVVSELVAQETNHPFESKNGIVRQAVVDWAGTLRPGS